MISDRKVWPDDYLKEGRDDTGIRCPNCNCPRSTVYNTLPTYGNRRRRIRICRNCGKRFSTFESR